MTLSNLKNQSLLLRIANDNMHNYIKFYFRLLQEGLLPIGI